MRVIIIGAGGLGRKVLGFFLEKRLRGDDVEVLGFVDENPSKQGQALDGVTVLGDLLWLSRASLCDFFVIDSVGSPVAAKKLSHKIRSLKLRLCNAIDPSAVVSPFATLEEGIKVFANAVIETGCVIGNHAIVNLTGTVRSRSKITSEFCGKMFLPISTQEEQSNATKARSSV